MSLVTSPYDMRNIPYEFWKIDMYAHALIYERQHNFLNIIIDMIYLSL